MNSRNFTRRLVSVLSLLFFAAALYGQIPDNYWDGTSGLTGDALKQKLHDIISTNVSYQSYTPGVWNAFYTTDVHPDNTSQIWDMYGEPAYTYTVGDDQCGTYGGEGDCYNREHSFPKSWFGGSTDPGPGTDLHHIFATDGYVNSRRSNYPYGNVGSATWTSLNGSKLGTCSDPNYSGTVFEPIDEYKGDFARALFYMAVMYKDELPTWYSNYAGDTDIDIVFQSDGTFQPWYYEMMYQWHVNDPVSEKELKRDTAVYNIQGNANPFVEHPEWVCMVFGGGSCVADPDNFVAQAATSSSIDLSWTLNADGDKVVLAYSTDGTFGTPSGNYSAGDAISGGGTVLYVGTNTSFSHTGLSQQTYYYKIWSQNSNGDYSGGVTASASPLKAEPADYPTNFTATASSASQIDLSWTDVSSSPEPEGYLILANTSGSFTAPSDGTDPSEDTDLSDGSAVVKVTQGTQAYSFTGLNATTTYYFVIYPYTNSGSAIDFKTDGTAPEANATTPDAPAGGCFSDLIISEYCEGSSYNKYIEIYNGTGSTVNLDDYRIGMVTNGGSWTESSISFTSGATIADGDVYVIANNQADQAVLDKADQTSGSLSFNGDDAVALQKTTDGGSTWTNVDLVGTDGADPGTAWDVAGVSNATKDHTLVRKATVNDPTTDWTASAGTTTDDSQWIVNGIDNFDDLGTHTADCGTTTCSEPTANASSISFSAISSTSVTVSWTNGDGENRVVLVKEQTDVDALPADGTTYTANAAYGGGSQIGSGNYVVYNSNGNSVTVTGLTAGRSYYFKVFEYNCSSGKEDYLTTGTIAAGNVRTLPENVTNFSVTCASESQIDLSWSLPNGDYDGVLVVALENATPDAPTCSGANLTNPQTDYSAADVYCSNSSGAKYVYNGTGTSVSVTGLSKGASYHFIAYVYSGDTWSTGSGEQIAVAQVDNVAALKAVCGNAESNVTWTNPSCFDGVIVAVNTSSVTAQPSGSYTVNSSSYTDANNPKLSDGSVVVYSGQGTSVNVTDLTNGTEYFIKVFVYKGSDWSSGSEVSCTPVEQTVLEYGDLAIVALNTNIETPVSGSDEIQFVCFKDITANTAIDFTDNGYERELAGKWGDTEGTVRITRTGNTVPAGTIITIQGNDQASNPTLGDRWNIYVGGTLDNDNWTIEYLNNVGTSYGNFDLNSTDQVWFMQGGDWLTNDTYGDHDDVYTGTVLYGWTATGWKDEPGYGSTSGSTLYPNGECSSTNLIDITNGDKVKYTGPTSAATQREWLSRFNKKSNWTGYADNTEYNNGGSLGSSITIVTGNFAQEWIGDVDSNWCNCANWGDLKVPDENSDVIFDASTAMDDLVLPDTSCSCRSLLLRGDIAKYKVYLSGSNQKVLTVKQDLTIEHDSLLVMDDQDPATLDGVLFIGGNWINNAGEAGFFEGNSTVIFNGTSTQQLQSTENETFYNVKFENSSSQGVTLKTNITALKTLTLQSGLLDLNGFDISIPADFHRTSGYFVGNKNSDITIENTGDLADFYFINNDTLNGLTLNRNAVLNLRTGLTVAGDLNILQGQLWLEPGKFYTVQGTLNNQQGSQGLVIGSSSVGTASLLHYTDEVPATVQIYMKANRWYYLNSSLSQASMDSLNTTSDGRTNNNIYTYDETKADYWNSTSMFGESGWTYAASNSVIDTAKAYIFFSPQERIYQLKGGNLHSGTRTIKLTYTQSGTGDVNVPDLGDRPWSEFDGWNLIGNPYPSAIDWDKVTLENVENVIYYYDGVEQNYKYYQGTGGTVYNQGLSVNGGSNIIPPNQGFFVKATANGSVTIDNTARVHTTSKLMKSKAAIYQQKFVRLRLAGNGFKDELIVQLDKDATDAFDAKFDAYKRFSLNPQVPQIYAKGNNGEIYAIDAVDEQNTIIIPLGFKVMQGGVYYLSAQTSNLDDYQVWLYDSLSAQATDLKKASIKLPQADAANYYLVLDKQVPPETLDNLIYVEIEQNDNITVDFDNYFRDSNLFDTLSYSIDDNEEITCIKLGKSLQIVGDKAGYFVAQVTATDKAGNSVTLPLEVKVNPADKLNDTEIKIYPNPATKYLYVNIPTTEESQITIFDNTGRRIRQIKVDKQQVRLDVSDLSEGVYMLEIYDGYMFKSFKFIKR